MRTIKESHRVAVSIAIAVCIQMRAWIHANFSLHVLTGIEQSKAEEADVKESEKLVTCLSIFDVVVKLLSRFMQLTILLTLDLFN